MSTRKPESPPRVFISYSQHDPAHSSRVRQLATALSKEGIDVELDQYHQQELVNWPVWCREQLLPENSDFVLMICSAEYKRRVENRVPADVGRGVYWEGGIVREYLYKAKSNERFIPVLFDDETEESMPLGLSEWTWFRIRQFGTDKKDAGYMGLYRLLTGQLAAPKPVRGEIKLLPPEDTSEKFVSGDVAIGVEFTTLRRKLEGLRPLRQEGLISESLELKHQDKILTSISKLR